MLLRAFTGFSEYAGSSHFLPGSSLCDRALGAPSPRIWPCILGSPMGLPELVPVVASASKHS